MHSDDICGITVSALVAFVIGMIAVQIGMTCRATNAENAATLRLCVEKHSPRECAGESVIKPSLEVR